MVILEDTLEELEIFQRIFHQNLIGQKVMKFVNN